MLMCSLVYGWMEDINLDNGSASPQSVVTAEEGETITLNIYYTENGLNPPGGFVFTIEAGGTATCNSSLLFHFSHFLFLHICQSVCT